MYLLIFGETKGLREKEEEKHPCERDTSVGCLSYTSQPGTEPTTQACALTKNWTSALLLGGMMPNQLSHTGRAFLDHLVYLITSGYNLKVAFIDLYSLHWFYNFMWFLNVI